MLPIRQSLFHSKVKVCESSCSTRIKVNFCSSREEVDGVRLIGIDLILLENRESKKTRLTSSWCDWQRFNWLSSEYLPLQRTVSLKIDLSQFRSCLFPVEEAVLLANTTWTDCIKAAHLGFILNTLTANSSSSRVPFRCALIDTEGFRSPSSEEIAR